MAQGRTEHSVEGEDRVLVFERVFDAPRDLVFAMFGDTGHLEHWWSPRGWELAFSELDFRPGGKWRYCMRCADPAQEGFYGMESWGVIFYHAIAAPERLEYTDHFSDAEGNLTTDLPTSDTVVEFIDLGGRTKLVSRTTYATAADLRTVLDMGMLEGVSQTWDRMEERLAELAT